MKYILQEKRGVHCLSSLEFDKQFNGIVSTCMFSETDKIMIANQKAIMKPILDYLGNNWVIVPVEEIKAYKVIKE